MDILTIFLITVVAGVVLLLIEYTIFKREGRVSVLTKIWNLAKGLARSIAISALNALRWLIARWQLMVGLTLIFVAALASYFVPGPVASSALVISLAAGILLLARWSHANPKAEFVPIPLPLGSVVSASINDKYIDLPRGEVDFGGVKFVLPPEGYAFDSSQARYIEADGTIQAQLTVPQSITKVAAIHLLINAGGAFRSVQGSEAALEWIRIGRITIIFQDQTYQETQLILGGNIREWAVGNAPGKLVDRVDDSHSKLAWRGMNNSARYAVIDQLEIPIQEPSIKKGIHSVVLVRDIPHGAPASQDGNIHFFVSAVTLERRL